MSETIVRTMSQEFGITSTLSKQETSLGLLGTATQLINLAQSATTKVQLVSFIDSAVKKNAIENTWQVTILSNLLSCARVIAAVKRKSITVSPEDNMKALNHKLQQLVLPPLTFYACQDSLSSQLNNSFLSWVPVTCC